MAFAKITTPVFRVSFPKVFTPESYDGGPLKYSVSAVWDPARFTKREKELWQSMLDLADEVSMAAFKKPIDKLPGNFRTPLRDGAEKEDLEGYGEGLMFCNLSSKMQPGIIDKDRNDILEAGEFYPGCYARATISCYSYDNKGKGVAFGLQNLQKVAEGDRLDSRTDASDDFDEADDDRWGAEDDPLED